MFLFINFKAYRESTSKRAIKLVKDIEKEFGDEKSIVLVLNPMDSLIETSLTKYIQSADPLNPGPFTGHIPIGILREYGYSGVMLNHSENKIGIDRIAESLNRASELGLGTLVCAADLKEMSSIIRMGPDFIAYEPPELIGGDISVSTAKPQIIEGAVRMLEGTKSKLVVGAGIKNRNDVRISRELGSEGILVASGVVKSPEPIRVIKEMMKEVV